MIDSKGKIKVKFVDFWTDMNKPEGNYFYELLSKNYEIEISDYPEILFYSNYGTEYLNYKCIRVFFSGENHRPDFTACDYAISFDYSEHPRHLRFPLWALYYVAYIKWLGAEKLDRTVQDLDLIENWEEKKKFCCFIVSNPSFKRRNVFFEKLNQRKHVDSVGKHLNNVGFFLEGGSAEKFKFIKDYRFVIAFENSSYPGYTTEKILEPLLAGCIPIYFGDPCVQKDFNTKRFINYRDFENEDALIERVLEIDGNVELALSILKEKCFLEEHKSIEVLEMELMRFLCRIVEGLGKVSVRAQSPLFVVLHKSKRFWIKYRSKLKSKLASN